MRHSMGDVTLADHVRDVGAGVSGVDEQLVQLRLVEGVEAGLLRAVGDGLGELGGDELGGHGALHA